MEIEKIKSVSDAREMSLNADKTCLFIVNFTKNHQFKPLLQILSCPGPLEIVLETKLLGYWLTMDMKAHRHVEYILKIAFKRIWAIRKLKKAGISDDDLLHFFFVKIRSVLESNCPVFHSILTQDDTDDIERIQKIVLRIILDGRYTGYDSACQILHLETLQARRTKLCLNFAIKSFRSDKFNLFNNNIKNFSYNLRTHQMFHLPFAATSRYYNSPRLYLCRLLQEHLNKTGNKLA